MLLLDTNSAVIQEMHTQILAYVNITVSTNTKFLGLDAHPGFSALSPAWCTKPAHVPLDSLYLSISTPGGLADALEHISVVLGGQATVVGAAASFMPATIVLEQSVSAANVVQLASLKANGSISLNLPLLLSVPLFPVKLGVPIPTSVALDLSGCLGCLALTDSQVHVYLASIQLTGLAPLGGPGISNSSSGGSSSGNSSSSSSGASLTLPLWAFHFDRSSDQVSCLPAQPCLQPADATEPSCCYPNVIIFVSLPCLEVPCATTSLCYSLPVQPPCAVLALFSVFRGASEVLPTPNYLPALPGHPSGRRACNCAT